MKKTFIAIAVLVILVVGGALIAPYFVGGTAERAFRADVLSLNARRSHVKFKVVAYHRGFYSSEATLTARMVGVSGADSKELMHLLLGFGSTPTIHVRINHGPIAIGAFGAHFSLVPVLYTADFKAAGLPPLSVLGALKPEFYDVAGFGGGHAFTVQVPPGRTGLGAFGAQWQGARATMDINGARDRMFQTGQVEPIKFQAMDPKTGETFSGTLKPFSWSSHSHKAAHGLWVGTSRFRYAGLDMSGQAQAHIKGGQGTGRTAETGHGRWYGWNMSTAQNGGTLRGWQWNQLTLSLMVQKLDAASLAKFSRMATAPAAASNVSLVKQQLARLLGNAVSRDTEGELQVRLDSPDGHATVHGTLDFADQGQGQHVSKPTLDAAHASLQVAFPPKLVTDLVAKTSGLNAAQKMQQTLQGLRQSGYLKKAADGRDTSTIVWTLQGTTVNGLPVGGRDAAPVGATRGNPSALGTSAGL